jgi:hypothetical protein
MQPKRDSQKQPAYEGRVKAPRKLRFDAPHPRVPRLWWWLRRSGDRPQN